MLTGRSWVGDAVHNEFDMMRRTGLDMAGALWTVVCFALHGKYGSSRSQLNDITKIDWVGGLGSKLLLGMNMQKQPVHTFC